MQFRSLSLEFFAHNFSYHTAKQTDIGARIIKSYLRHPKIYKFIKKLEVKNDRNQIFSSFKKIK